MQFFIDQNQVTYQEFLTKVNAASFLTNSQDQPIEVHFEDGKTYLTDSKCQKIELLIPKALNYHEKFFYKNSLYRQPLFKAIGLKKGKDRPHVLDCTGGTLKDALLLYFGLKKISVCERNPLAQFLIQTALDQNNLSDFHFYPLDIKEMNLDEFDVLYYDPMFEGGNKKAAPRKEMQFFREYIGKDSDQLDILNLLIKSNKRVVLKRSQKSDALLSPSMSFGEKSTVYDVYLP
jgi:16S rRNA (guanine1516-N2)-methyltransferase